MIKILKMKRLFSLAMLAMAAFPCAVNAQNIQVHYDLGHSLYNDIDKRPSMTTTMEMFKPDRWGSTFAFIDLDYQRDGVPDPPPRQNRQNPFQQRILADYRSQTAR